MKHDAHNSIKVAHGCIESGKMDETFLSRLRLGHAPMMKLYHLGVICKPSTQIEHLCVTCPMKKLTKQPYKLN